MLKVVPPALNNKNESYCQFYFEKDEELGEGVECVVAFFREIRSRELYDRGRVWRIWWFPLVQLQDICVFFFFFLFSFVFL